MYHDTISHDAPAIAPPIILTRDPRIGQSHTAPSDIAYEARIVWLIDPARLRCPYVREGLNLRCTRTGPIGQHRDGGLVAYSVLYRDAPPFCGSRGVWLRRTFWISAASDPYPGSDFPAEAVDPATIAPRVPGRITERMLDAMRDRRASR